jgi:hypothetical protein
MLISARKSCPTLLAAGGIAIGSLLVAPPAQAAPCTTTPIQKIVDDGTYTCLFGKITYTFNSSMVELAHNPGASLRFEHSSAEQKIIFDGLANSDLMYFTYNIQSPYESIIDIEQTYTPYPVVPPPLTPPNDFNASGIRAVPGLPSIPSDFDIEITALLEPDTYGFPPYPVFTSLTHTIYKTPSPLPLAGAGLAFAFSRRLRQRIHRSL